MMGLSNSILRLRSLQPVHAPLARARLKTFAGFGSNPGALVCKSYVPEDLAPGAALVVVLHGCTQDAESYDYGSGWSQIANEQGFALLFPQQTRANNLNLCFNWFEPGDTKRASGEVASIVQMVEAMVVARHLDRCRVFVTGLSAGGAMTSALLAAYPEVFAGGAIIAGLPYGAAASVPEALTQMRRASVSAPSVRAASDHDGPWPTISIWHGDADHVVDASNASAILGQWRAVHGVEDASGHDECDGGCTRRVWSNAAGRDVIEHNIISGMGHGTPLATSGAEGCGTEGPHMLEVGVSSTRQIAQFWGLCRTPRKTRPAVTLANDGRVVRPTNGSVVQADSEHLSTKDYVGTGPGRVIEDALRAAGLMH